MGNEAIIPTGPCMLPKAVLWKTEDNDTIFAICYFDFYRHAFSGIKALGKKEMR